jgi:CheY-like chemotaxis protein
MIISEKESFLVRVLIKKVEDSGTKCVFSPWDINEINKRWEGTFLVTVFMDREVRPGKNVLHFLNDRLEEEGNSMIVVGDPDDIKYVCGNVSKKLIYKTLERPIDNNVFVAAVTEITSKMNSGDFKKSILIVDDDPGYLSLVREWLKDTYKVSMASSGLQAIKWLGKNKADLILLDHEMPVTNGPQVLEMLRSDEETRNIPVIFLTGKNDKNSVMAVVALRPEGYFLKTIGKDELLEKLKEFFILHKGV